MRSLLASALGAALALSWTADAAAAHDFSACKKVDDKLGVERVAFQPDPPRAGKPLRVQVDGTSRVALAGGKVHVDVRIFGVTVASETRDACSVFACPLQAGQAYSAAVEQEIPAETPDKLTATVRVSVVDDAGATASCLESQVVVANKEPEGVLGATRWGLMRDEVAFMFARWAAQHKRHESADGDKLERLLAVFRDNIIRVADHNADKSRTFTMALNKFADMSADEFARVYLSGYKDDPDAAKARRKPLKDLVTLRGSVALADPPQEIDWVAKGAVNPVVDQGACGSCWAFSATAALEGAVFLKTGKLVKLSEQELVSCDGDGMHGGSDYGCQGGLMDSAWDWLSKSTSGMCAEADYPYQSGMTSARGQCRLTECAPVEGTKPVGFVDVPPGEAPLVAALAQHGPISVAIEADQAAFQFYHSGVLVSQCGTHFNHGVVITGMGVDQTTGIKYWGVRNSWGPNWGEEGYVKIQRGKRWPNSQCGIELRASYPLLDAPAAME